MHMTDHMGRVTCDLTVSVDGYSAGLSQTEERPFGDDGGDGWGDKLHAWFAETSEENRAEIDQMTAAKAFIMGRNMFGPVRGEEPHPIPERHREDLLGWGVGQVGRIQSHGCSCCSGRDVGHARDTARPIPRLSQTILRRCLVHCDQ